MEKKEYLVGVTIIESRSLKGLDSAGTSDPFVKIKCANKPVQVTQKSYKTNSVVWNQSFTFPGVIMNQYELETFELILEVYDYNSVKANELIGQSSIGLSTLYRNLNHEFYRVWIALYNPDIPNGEVQGYLQVSCFIVGPNERPPAHAVDDIVQEEEEMNEENEAGLTDQQKVENMKKRQGLFLLQEPGIVRKGYQLSVNILKAEGLPQCDNSGQCNSFISVRVSGTVQITRVIEENFNPVYNARLCFPVFVPIYNDKITIRVWSRNQRTQDTFIANVPEHPSGFDAFNISKLLANDGKMRATWFNLYGVHPLDRAMFQNNNGNKKEGSYFLGRILISMSLIPNDKPQIYQTIANPQKEPNSQNYLLWVDTYDFILYEEGSKGRQIDVQAWMGIHQSKQHIAKYKEQTDTYIWPQVCIKSLKVNFPYEDLHQIPDIFINFYSQKSFSREYRVGYIRLQAKDCMHQTSNPQWYRLKSTNNENTCPGIVLMNVQYVRESMANERYPKPRGVEAPFQFFAYIFSGFEIAPGIKAEKLNTRVEMRIGRQNNKQKEQLVTEKMTGRYPQWNKAFLGEEVLIDKTLKFASDLRVQLVNHSKTAILRSDQREILGEFSVPLKSIAKNLYERPQYFNFIGNDGQLQGQVLALFYLKMYDPKMQKEAKIISDFFYNIRNISQYTVDIDISIFGIRNLNYSSNNPKISVRLTNGHQDLKDFSQKQKKNSKNPNFGAIETFKGIQLPKDPLLWPMLEVKIVDSGQYFGLGGCESCYTTIPLFEFTQGLFEDEEIIHYTRAQINRNQNKISIVQPYINPERFKNKYVKNNKFSNMMQGGNLTTDSEPDMTEEGDDNQDFGYNMAGGKKIKEFQNDNFERFSLPVLDDDSDDQDYNRQKSYVQREDSNQNVLKVEDVKINIFARKRQPARQIFGEEESLNDSLEQYEQNDNKPDPYDQKVGKFDGFILNNIIDLKCTPIIKQKENEDRNRMKDFINQEIGRITLKLEDAQSQNQRETLNQKLLELKNKQQELEEEEMKEDKFWGYIMDDDDPQANVYNGRDVVRDGTYEQRLRLPYDEFPLFAMTGSNNKVAQVGGLLRSGPLTGAQLKAKIKVRFSRNDDQQSSSDEDLDEDIDENQPQSFRKKQTIKDKDLKTEANDDNKLENLLNSKIYLHNSLSIEIYAIYPYDITNQIYLQELNKSVPNFKVRLYLLSCQNLSATYSQVDLLARLEGLSALCTANPYPIIIVGEGSNDNVNHRKKYISDRDKPATQDLNPKFYRTYELDVNFPEDWKLELFIYDKRTFGYLDELIGSTIVDLEDRLYGDLKRQVMDSLVIKKKYYQSKKGAKGLQSGKRKQYEMKIEQINKHIQKLSNKEEEMMPVEFRELRHPNKKQAQGIAEMWVEVMTQEQARKTPMTRIQMQSKDEYEIRLIIWETRDVPLINGDSVDIYVKVLFDPTGWSGNPVQKQTDIHYGSKDGRGVFNYRFKFDVSYPCEFPRLKFQLYDFGVLTDESIGESILNLKKTMNLLVKEGRIDLPKSWLSFNSPNNKNDDCGQLLISMQILPKNEAEQTPVGEAQNEPNENPKLEKPSEGRGVKDRILAATNIDVGKFSIPKVNFMRNFIIIGVIFGIPSRMAKLARKRKAAKMKEREAKRKIKEKLEKIKKQVASMQKMRQNLRKKRARQEQPLDLLNEDELDDEQILKRMQQQKEEEEKQKNEEQDHDDDEEFKGMTLEEQLAELEKSDQSDLELIRNSKKNDRFFSDSQWKLIVGVVGSGIDLALVFITLQMVEALLSGSF